jgi:DNA repair exonuclease SbcCD ATPase subunit
MTPEEIREKIENLQTRHAAVTAKKNSLGGQLQAKKEELATLITEIRAAGYDPKKLVAEKEKAQQDLEAMIIDFDKKLMEAERALSVYDKK